MISDVLFEAVQEIDRYLHDPAFERAYPRGSVEYAEIMRVRGEIERVRVMLDTPPSVVLGWAAAQTALRTLDTAIAQERHLDDPQIEVAATHLRRQLGREGEQSG